VYSVCTLTRAETSEIVRSFAAAHPEFAPAPVFPDAGAPQETSAILWPHELNANGMFIAAWRKRA